MKTCKTCNTPKELNEENFHKRTVSKDGFNDDCKQCACEKVSASRKKYADRIRTYNREYGRRNPDKVKKWNRENRVRNYEVRMLHEAKTRATRRGLPFSITKNDFSIPECCPVLGIVLEIGEQFAKYNSPSLDAIRPELGYVPGNVAVISHRANSIKNDASVEELRRVADWLERALPMPSPQ